MANKLELLWLGKENSAKPEPRVLVERKDLSFSQESDSLIEETYDEIMKQVDNYKQYAD